MVRGGAGVAMGARAAIAACGCAAAAANVPSFAAAAVVTGSALVQVGRLAVRVDRAAERPEARPVHAVMTAARGDGAERDTGDRAVEVGGLGAVEDHARKLGADVPQVADRFFD